MQAKVSHVQAGTGTPICLQIPAIGDTYRLYRNKQEGPIILFVPFRDKDKFLDVKSLDQSSCRTKSMIHIDRQCFSSGYSGCSPWRGSCLTALWCQCSYSAPEMWEMISCYSICTPWAPSILSKRVGHFCILWHEFQSSLLCSLRQGLGDHGSHCALASGTSVKWGE